MTAPTALAVAAPLDPVGWTAVVVALLLILAYGYAFDPVRRDRARRRRVEDLVAVARAVGVISLDHVECEGDDCDVVLCLDDETCPGFAELACAHLNLLCGDCRIGQCADCRIDARHDAGVL